MPGNETISGHIEKKKHRIARARDFQEKNNKLKHLRRKAEERNPDEFHFHMTRSQVGFDGIHRDIDLSDEDTEIQKLLGDVRDLKYVRHKLSVELKKIEKLKGILHLSEVGGSKNSRVVFVDSESDAKSMAPMKTHSVEKVNAKCVSPDDYLIERAEKEKRKQYSELAKRMERAEELQVVLNKIELKKNLALHKRTGMKPKLISKGGPTKAASYQWHYERKK